METFYDVGVCDLSSRSYEFCEPQNSEEEESQRH